MTLELLLQMADLGTTGILLAVLWLGLQRFDKLLDLIIKLAELGTQEDVENLRDILNGDDHRRR